MNRVQIDLCTGFVKIGEASAYTFLGSLRHLAAGSWMLTAPDDGVECSTPALVDSVIVTDTDTGVIQYAGVLREGGDAAAFIRTETVEGIGYQWSGTDLFGLLASRVAFPNPATDEPWSVSHDVNSGAASSVLAAYIEDNVGVSARPDRQIGLVDVADPVIGDSIEFEARLLTIDQVARDIGTAAGLAVDAKLDGGRIVYQLRLPVDRSDTIIVADVADLERSIVATQAPTGTWVLGAGGGVQEDRLFRTASSGATGFDRVEYLYDNPNIAGGATMTTTVANQLADRTGRVLVDARIAEGAPNVPTWRTDYLLGDLIGIQIDGERFAAQVTSVEFDLSADRLSVRPIFGRGVGDDLTKLLDTVDSFTTAFARIIQ